MKKCEYCKTDVFNVYIEEKEIHCINCERVIGYIHDK